MTVFESKSVFTVQLLLLKVQTLGPEDKDTCYLADSIALMFFGTTMNLLIVLSADRYWAICMPLSHKVHKDAVNKKIIIFGCIFVGVFTGSFPIMGWNKDIYAFGCYPLEMFSPGHLVFCSVWILASTAIISTFYLFIFKAIRDHVSFCF